MFTHGVLHPWSLKKILWGQIYNLSQKERKILIVIILLLLVILYTVPDSNKVSPTNMFVENDSINEYQHDETQLIIYSNQCQQTILKLIEKNELYLSDHIDIFIKSKLIVLTIPKSGSTFYKILINEIDSKTKHINNRYRINLKHEIKSRDFVNNESLSIYISQYYCSMKYKKYIIIRDPLTRLLSGYLDKCTDNIRSWTEDWHNHCKYYLQSIGIDIFYWRQFKSKSNMTQKQLYELNQLNKHNTFLSFIRWLNRKKSLNKYIDGHFRNTYLFSRMDIFKQYWNMINVNNMDRWNELASKIANVSALNFTQRIHTFHETNATKQLSKYFGIHELLLSIKYLWKDYYVFDLIMPQWICIVILNKNKENRFSKSIHSLKLFMNRQFVEQNKSGLLPNCVVQSQ
eukprot:303509_1